MTPLEVQNHISNAKLKKQTAFNALLNQFWNDVYSYQLTKTKDENLAEDVTIQTFSKAFDKIKLFDEAYSFKTWLLSISKNIHIDTLRKKRKTDLIIDNQMVAAYDISDTAPTPEDQLIIAQNLAELLQFVKRLKPHYQKVIQLRYFQEMSYKEIASELEEPVNNVKIKLLRAKKLLAEIIRNKI
jgi:RNA polymerase sigma-70 factor, ECF subfamily